MVAGDGLGVNSADDKKVLSPEYDGWVYSLQGQAAPCPAHRVPVSPPRVGVIAGVRTLGRLMDHLTSDNEITR